jgi:hypothetical protein
VAESWNNAYREFQQTFYTVVAFQFSEVAAKEICAVVSGA